MGLKSWAVDLDENTLRQASRTSRMPFVRSHVALMPDAHFGTGSTVGSVIPTEGAIMPAAVGVDIGCGMIAVRTNLGASNLPDTLDPLLDRIAQVVPAGVGQGHEHANVQLSDPPGTELTVAQATTAIKQFGTLGAGNHFVEVCLDETDQVWAVLHSGSRGIGNQLARRHIDGAKGLMEQWFIELEDPDLAYLIEGTPEFDAYIGDMLWAQEYARASREKMMNAVLDELLAVANHPFGEELQRINCHHNFTQLEYRMGRKMWITRKGAIKADIDDWGVIPGSMGASTFIVQGLGNPGSYSSCSHGAGRRLSRTAARDTLDPETFVAEMGDRAWNRDRAGETGRGALIEEDPRAYKDIDEVMEAQKDLVCPVYRLHQVLNYKG